MKTSPPPSRRCSLLAGWLTFLSLALFSAPASAHFNPTPLNILNVLALLLGAPSLGVLILFVLISWLLGRRESPPGPGQKTYALIALVLTALGLVVFPLVALFFLANSQTSLSVWLVFLLYGVPLWLFGGLSLFLTRRLYREASTAPKPPS